jgi:hypothetical protein
MDLFGKPVGVEKISPICLFDQLLVELFRQAGGDLEIKKKMRAGAALRAQLFAKSLLRPRDAE